MTEYPIPAASSLPYAITAGPDGNLWFTEHAAKNVARITPSGAITEFSVAAGLPTGITLGPDGNLWFAGGTEIGRVTPTGGITGFPVPLSHLSSGATYIASGPDGNMWFTYQAFAAGSIDRMTLGGIITPYTTGPSFSNVPEGIAAGPDGNIWFTEFDNNAIGRITPSGSITEFSLPTANSEPTGIVAGSDGNLWFTESAGNKVGRITPSGSITEFPIPTAASQPTSIAAGGDGNLWFTENAGEKIGKITPAGIISEFSVPPSSGPYGIAAGPDGNLWFTEIGSNSIGKLTPVAGRLYQTPLTASPAPTDTHRDGPHEQRPRAGKKKQTCSGGLSRWKNAPHAARWWNIHFVWTNSMTVPSRIRCSTRSSKFKTGSVGARKCERKEKRAPLGKPAFLWQTSTNLNVKRLPLRPVPSPLPG